MTRGDDLHADIQDDAGLRWRDDRVPLEFRIGPLDLGRSALQAFRLVTPCLKLSTANAPVNGSLPTGCNAAYCPALPVETELPIFAMSGGAIRYVLRQEQRYFVVVEGSHEAYLAKFSGKTRNTFRRHLKRFTESSGGSLHWRTYRTPDEVREFHASAISLSRASYQHSIGYGLPDTPSFVDELADDAGRGRVRGYLLFHDGVPAAYALCPIVEDVMEYARLGYSPAFENLSPGRVLLLLILEQLFEEKSVRYLDFGAQEFSYKSQFATDQMRTARVLYVRPTVANVSLLAAHATVRGVWNGLSLVRSLIRGPARA